MLCFDGLAYHHIMETDSVKSFDVIVIGGGAAGIMAALSVKEHHPDFSVAILDPDI